MYTQKDAEKFANDWINAWNFHDIELIIEHYAEDVQFISPFIVKLLDEPSGTIHGAEDLKAYFSTGLKKYPDLNFKFHNVLLGQSSITLIYTSVNNLLAAEVMELNADNKVVRVLAHYREE